MIISEQQRKSRKYKQTTGNFSSCKMRTSVSYFSLLQKDFMYWLEFDPDVMSYTTSTAPLECYDNGKQKLYVPDFQVIRHHKRQIIEVKSHKIIKSQKYRRLYPLLSEICNDTGWEFIVLTESQVQRELTLSNIKLLYRYARENFSIDQYQDCLAILQSSVPTSLAEIGQALDHHNIRRNVLFKLLFYSLVEIDLKKSISGNSVITAVSKSVKWEVLFNG